MKRSPVARRRGGTSRTSSGPTPRDSRRSSRTCSGAARPPGGSTRRRRRSSLRDSPRRHRPGAAPGGMQTHGRLESRAALRAEVSGRASTGKREIDLACFAAYCEVTARKQSDSRNFRPGCGQRSLRRNEHCTQARTRPGAARWRRRRGLPRRRSRRALVCSSSAALLPRSRHCRHAPRSTPREAIAASSFSCSHRSIRCDGRIHAIARSACSSEPWLSTATMALACAT